MTFRLTRVEAPSMDEALEKVRSMLGSDAMIVSSRTFRRGGLLGFGGRELVEVFAAEELVDHLGRKTAMTDGTGKQVRPDDITADKVIRFSGDLMHLVGVDKTGSIVERLESLVQGSGLTDRRNDQIAFTPITPPPRVALSCRRPRK